MSTAVRKRFEEFDIGRAAAILGLPIVHVLEEMQSIGVISDTLVESHHFLLILSAFGAPLFMACLGANIMFSRRSDAKFLAKRGLMLLAAGMLLNIARFGLPDVIFGGITGIYNMSDGEFFCITASSDIYDFAGACFLTFALLIFLKLKPGHILIIAVVLLILGAYVMPIFFANPEWTPLTGFMGRFFWVNEYSWFPLMTWFIFPATGYFFGSWYKKASEGERDALCKKMLPVGLAVLVAAVVIVLALGGNPLLVYATPANSYITDIPCVIMQIATLACVFPLMRTAALRLQGTKALEKIVWLSSCIMPYYIVQWLLVGWLETIIFDFGYENVILFNAVSFWIVSLATMAASLLIVKAWDVWRKRRREAKLQAAASC